MRSMTEVRTLHHRHDSLRNHGFPVTPPEPFVIGLFVFVPNCWWVKERRSVLENNGKPVRVAAAARGRWVVCDLLFRGRRCGLCDCDTSVCRARERREKREREGDTHPPSDAWLTSQGGHTAARYYPQGYSPLLAS